MLKKIILFVKVFLSLLLFVILFQTCSDDDSPTTPTETPPLTSETIGNGGGTLKSDDFELSVPVGAFATDTKLTLKLVENEDSGFDNISKEYKLEGLPTTFTKPLTVKLKYSGELTNSSYIALGEETYVKSLDTIKYNYRMIEARDSSGYLVASIPPSAESGLLKESSNTSLKEEEITIGILAVSGHATYKSAQGHFLITFPSSVVTEAQDLAEYLEIAYTKIKDLGFSYAKRTKWPVEVTVKKLGSGVYGYSTNSMWGDNYGYMEFNVDKLGNPEDLKLTAGHEFFHLVQSLYDPRNRYSKAKSQSPNLWIDEASSVWSEELFSDDVNYVSDVFATSADMTIYGANKSVGDNAQSYGYGMASFLKYIKEENGDEILVKIYDEISKDHESFSAIDNVLPEPTFSIWDDFLKKYLIYDIYKGKGFEPRWLFKESVSLGRKFVIQNDSDTLKIFSDKYPNLSAHVFSVNVKDNNLNQIDENSQLVFSTEGEVIGNILLFKENASECVFLDEGLDSLKLNNFKKITDEGYIIIAVVTNVVLVYPYTKEAQGKLTIKVVNNNEPPPVITEIFDYNYFRGFNEKRHFSPSINIFRITGTNFNDVQKVWINGIESENIIHNFIDPDLLVLQLSPINFTGHITVKVVTSSSESNEFPYLLGYPIDYLATTDSIYVENSFTVKYYDTQGEELTQDLELKGPFMANELSWSNNVLTINLNKINEIAGSIVCTFSELENGIMEKVAIDYSCENPKYTLHFEDSHLGCYEDIYLIQDNPFLIHNLIVNIFHYHFKEQPIISGTIEYYDRPTGEHKETTFNEIDLSAPSSNRQFLMKFAHFHD